MLYLRGSLTTWSLSKANVVCFPWCLRWPCHGPLAGSQTWAWAPVNHMEPVWSLIEWICFQQRRPAPLQHPHLMVLLCILPKTWSLSRALNAALECFYYGTVSMRNYIQIEFRHSEYFFKDEKSNNWEKFNVKWVNTDAISFWITLGKSDGCQLLRWERQRDPGPASGPESAQAM